MRQMKWLVMAIVAFLMAIVGEGLVKRAISFLLCGVLSATSTTCYAMPAIHGPANAMFAPKEIFTLSQAAEHDAELAQIPRIRKPSLELPVDFRVVSQVPFSSGKREILFASRSTGAEQVYSTSLPDANQFELFGVEFRKVSGLDFRPLLVGKDIQIDPTELESTLKEFKILFKDNALSKVVLADGRIAEFTASQAVIKSPKGTELEKIPLSSVRSSADGTLISQSAKVKNLDATVGKKFSTDQSDLVIVQAGSPSCQSGTKSYLQSSSQQMSQIGEQLVANASKNSLLVGGALNYGNTSMQNSGVAKDLTDTVCTPPIKCNEEVISGGSEIRADLFQVPQGENRQVTLEYEFYDVPDKLEMDFDGKRVFSIGPASGRNTQNFSFPNNAKYVGVKLTGNQDIKTTKWWYKVACSGNLCSKGSAVMTKPLSGSLFNNEYAEYSRNAQDAKKLTKAEINDVLGMVLKTYELDDGVKLGTLAMLLRYGKKVIAKAIATVTIPLETVKKLAQTFVSKAPGILAKLEEARFDSSNNYHYYRLRTKVCEVSEACTQKSVYQFMLRKQKYTAPNVADVSNNGNNPVQDNAIIKLRNPFTFLGFGADVQAAFRSSIDILNPVLQVTNPDGYEIRNTTMPGHILHPGYIVRRIIEENCSIFIETIGEGIGGDSSITPTVLTPVVGNISITPEGLAPVGNIVEGGELFFQVDQIFLNDFKSQVNTK